MRKMLLSFKPEVYEKIKSGKKKFEHRRNFPDESVMAYMYVSSPVKAITGIVYLGKRHCLFDWLGQFTRNYTQTVKRAADNKRRYAPGEGSIPPVLLSGVSKGVPPLAHDFACKV